MADPRYKRVLLKISGEAFCKEGARGVDISEARSIAGQVCEASQQGSQIAIVVGGGNIVRGGELSQYGINEAQGDYMGMLATVINALALQDVLEQMGKATRVMTAIPVQAVAETFLRRRALRHLEKGRVVILAAGTGNPHFTTDTAAALRAIEIHGEVLLMAKNGVDGVYEADPRVVPNARRLDTLTHLEALQRQLQVMDSTALSLCMENRLPIVVFDAAGPDSIYRALAGDDIGTVVSAPPEPLQSTTD